MKSIERSLSICKAIQSDLINLDKTFETSYYTLSITLLCWSICMQEIQ